MVKGAGAGDWGRPRRPQQGLWMGQGEEGRLLHDSPACCTAAGRRLRTAAATRWVAAWGRVWREGPEVYRRQSSRDVLRLLWGVHWAEERGLEEESQALGLGSGKAGVGWAGFGGEDRVFFRVRVTTHPSVNRSWPAGKM